MLKLGRMDRQTGETFVNPTAKRDIRLLKFATFVILVLTNTLSPHKQSIRWTWDNPDGKHHTLIDYVLVRKRFQSGVKEFPWCRYDLVMMTFLVRLKKARKQT